MKYTKWTTESTSYLSTGSARMTAHIRMSSYLHTTGRICLLGLGDRYMVSPWMKNGSVINYVKSNDNQVDYRKLVGLCWL